IMAARLSFLVSGSTGSGKTTVLGTLLSELPDHERLVIVEDSAELRPSHHHVVALQSRPANIEGAGLVTMRDLVRQALRMRPDRIVVGEVRGAEVVDLLAAFNTGHEGGCGTVHANSASDVPARLQALGLMAGLDRAAVQALLVAGLQVLIHLDRESDGVRRITGIHTLSNASSPSAGVRTSAAFVGHRTGLRPGPGLAHLASLIRSRGIRPPRVPAR
ncbi:MAG: CpaF family protein, partial [Actinomycetales bacterium]